MKKFIFFYLLIIFPFAVNANPMFGENDDNSISMYIGHGTGSGTLLKLIQPGLWDFNKMTFAMVQYSQPTTFFRLPARQSLHVIQNFSYEEDKSLSFAGVGVSIDAALFTWNGFYLGFGLGPYMRDSLDNWVSSRLVFGEKFFVGKNLSDRWRAELFTIHFSNGNFTNTNAGFNFTGFSIGYSF